MSQPSLSTPAMAFLLREMASDLRDHSEELRLLDSQGGDGDLGVTVELAGKAIIEYLPTSDLKDAGRLLMNCGMNINNASPSTFGTLLATAFMGAGKAILGKEEITGNDLAAMGQGAIDSIRKRGKAATGDKTLLDALDPACKAFQQEFGGSGDIRTALVKAAEAAEKGMKATVDMPAKYGRVSWRPDHGVGVQDGGATAMYYLIDSVARHFAELPHNNPGEP